MQEAFDSYYADRIFSKLDKVKFDLDNEKSFFLDLFEFEELIDYFLGHYEVDYAYKAVNLALYFYPYSSSLKFRLARILTFRNEKTKALRILREIREDELSTYDYHLLKGEIYVKHNRIEEAILEFDKAIKKATLNRGDVIYEIAQIFSEEGKDNLATKYLLLAYEFDKNNIVILYDLAYSFEKLGYHDKSIEYYNKYLDNVYYQKLF